ncbi:uncharacterized protein with PIN domain [Thalassospira tepidiphila]|uniref:Uncharacterized protein with PIN domain n=1 Tax=Thalassospira tepidiphila TaxID=393657 RepID=A0ABX0X5Z5_9PROT|nr:uncharacterized protein with PIN domain [Thalassospira tepidiphila]
MKKLCKECRDIELVEENSNPNAMYRNMQLIVDRLECCDKCGEYYWVISGEKK